MRPCDVLIVLFDGCHSLDVTGPLEVLHGAGAPYTLRTASVTGATVRTSSGLRLEPDLALGDAGVPDLLLVPGGAATRDPDRRLVAWIRRHAPEAARVAAVCTGAFLRTLDVAPAECRRRFRTPTTRSHRADRHPAL